MCSLGRSLQLQHCGKTAAAVVTTYRITILVNYAIKFVHWGLMCLVYGYFTEVVDVDVDVGSAFLTFLNTGIPFYDILSFTRGRRCSGVIRYDILYDIFSHHKATALVEFMLSECSS